MIHIQVSPYLINRCSLREALVLSYTSFGVAQNLSGWLIAATSGWLKQMHEAICCWPIKK